MKEHTYYCRYLDVKRTETIVEEYHHHVTRMFDYEAQKKELARPLSGGWMSLTNFNDQAIFKLMSDHTNGNEVYLID